VSEATIRIGAPGLGSVSHGPGTGMSEGLANSGRVRVATEIAGDFPRPDLAALEAHPDGERVDDPRPALV
jgi:hypothetical protein